MAIQIINNLHQNLPLLVVFKSTPDDKNSTIFDDLHKTCKMAGLLIFNCLRYIFISLRQFSLVQNGIKLKRNYYFYIITRLLAKSFLLSILVHIYFYIFIKYLLKRLTNKINGSII